MNNKLNLNRMIASLSLLFIISSQLSGQIKWKKYFLTGSSQLISGMLDGTIESISFHYENGFKTRFPHVNDKFWNPALSWKNKYKDGNCEAGAKFFGSTTIFASTTDAYHLLRTSKRSLDMFTLVCYANKECSDKKILEFVDKKKAKKKWKGVARDFIILTAIRCAGFHLTYSLLFKPQKNFEYK